LPEAGLPLTVMATEMVMVLFSLEDRWFGAKRYAPAHIWRDSGKPFRDRSSELRMTTDAHRR
jgi:hypothetical protein